MYAATGHTAEAVPRGSAQASTAGEVGTSAGERLVPTSVIGRPRRSLFIYVALHFFTVYRVGWTTASDSKCGLCVLHLHVVCPYAKIPPPDGLRLQNVQNSKTPISVLG